MLRVARIVPTSSPVSTLLRDGLHPYMAGTPQDLPVLQGRRTLVIGQTLLELLSKVGLLAGLSPQTRLDLLRQDPEALVSSDHLDAPGAIDLGLRGQTYDCESERRGGVLVRDRRQHQGKAMQERCQTSSLSCWPCDHLGSSLMASMSSAVSSIGVMTPLQLGFTPSSHKPSRSTLSQNRFAGSG